MQYCHALPLRTASIKYANISVCTSTYMNTIPQSGQRIQLPLVRRVYVGQCMQYCHALPLRKASKKYANISVCTSTYMNTKPQYMYRYIGLRNLCWVEISVFLCTLIAKRGTQHMWSTLVYYPINLHLSPKTLNNITNTNSIVRVDCVVKHRVIHQNVKAWCVVLYWPDNHHFV